MTIYAWKHNLDGEIVTIIPAADTAAELDKWHAKNFVEEGTGTNYTNSHLTEVLEHLFDDDLKSFKKPLMIFTHATEEDRDTFIDGYGLEVVRHNAAIDAQETMIWVQKTEAEKAEEDRNREEGKRVTIGEATGTAENDPWDTVPEETAVMAAPKGVTGHGHGAHGGEGKLKKAEDKQEIDNTKTEDEDDPGRILVRGTEVDQEGNINVDIAVLDEREQEEVKKMRAEARKKEEEKKQKIREMAASVGIDADKPDTYTAIEAGDTVVQQDNRLKIIETVFSNGKRMYRDMETGMGVNEDDIETLRKKREAQAVIADIEAEEERKKAAAEAEDQREEEEKSDLRKKLEKAQGITAADKPVEVDPAVRGEELTAQIGEAIEAGVAAGAVRTQLEDLVESDQITREFADQMVKDLELPEATDEEADQIAVRKIRQALREANDIYRKLAGQGDNTGININRQNTPKKDGRKGDDYYFAVLPPGAAGTDELTATLGQEAFIVLIPKKEFDKDGKIPGTDGGWFTAEELAEWETKSGIAVEEIAPSVYKMDCNIGDGARHFRTIGATESGLLLMAMGIAIDNIPFDWPYHYHANGHRVTDNEMRMQAVRILQIARDNGWKVEDEDGSIDDDVAGIDQTAIAKTEQDITADLKKALGASGNTEDDVMEILQEALERANARIAEANLTVGDLQNIPAEIKVLLENV